jgi:eukaryotic-like serine/threonine-protein kinase
LIDVVADETLVMERFRLLERIGSGGMGTVYRAFDERLQREVAVKEIAAPDPERVVREAQAAARLNHPGIVTLYELGERGGHAVLVSELVPGETLAELCARNALSDRDLGEIAADLCSALAHAHARGVVHRDVKPQNVIVRGEAGVPGAAKLMDFGIARIAGAPTLTAAGEVVGTLAYMSPEQAEGRISGPESDVYSLALTLRECLTGANPVVAPSPAATARRIGTPVAPLRESRPDLPEGLADMLDACLDADPELRPTAAELGECVEAELGALDADRPLPSPDGTTVETGAEARGIDLGRVAALVGVATALVLLAAALGAGGIALVASVLIAPMALVGTRVAPVVAASPLLAAVGLGPGAAALGAAGSTAPARAVLGACGWAWILVAAVTAGVGPDLPFAGRAESGWAGDPATAAESVLTPLVSPESLLLAGVFAAAAAGLGAILAARHASIALLGAMLWAAALASILGAVAGGALGGSALAVVAVAAAAVLAEFGVVRPAEPLPRRHRRRAPDSELAGAQLSERLA